MAVLLADPDATAPFMVSIEYLHEHLRSAWRNWDDVRVTDQHRVIARIRLDEAWLSEKPARIGFLSQGNNSWLFRFSSLDASSPGPKNFGAIIEACERRGDDEADVELFFWGGGVARIYASTGAQFQIWYGGVIGSGEIISVVDPLADGEVNTNG